MKTLRIVILFSVIVLYTTPSQSQARLVINNNAYVVINGGTIATPSYIVVENGNANAVTTTGTGGNLVSENEFNKLRWNIGTNTGTYILPYTSNPFTTNTKFPLSVQITAAGIGAGFIDFSTYETTTDMNIPWASMVTHMTDADNVPADNSLKVVDRYWLMINNSYATKPDVNLTFGYVDNPSELGGTNSIIEGNLVAQRWNDASNEWEGNVTNTFIMYGAANTVSNQVFGVDIPPAEFHEAWVLVDNQSLLPVEFVSIHGNCKNDLNEIIWSTASETGSLYYVLEKSLNGNDFFQIDTVNAVGFSNLFTEYSITDPVRNFQLVYYRIKQIDINENFFYFPVIAISPCDDFANEVSIYTNANNQISIDWMSLSEGNLKANLFSVEGKLIANQSFNYVEGFNQMILPVHPATGIYFVQITNENQTFSQKIFIK